MIEYQELISSDIAHYFNLTLDPLAVVINQNDEEIIGDRITISPINNVWNCPICQYGHSNAVDACVLCGYCKTITKGKDLRSAILCYQRTLPIPEEVGEENPRGCL